MREAQGVVSISIARSSTQRIVMVSSSRPSALPAAPTHGHRYDRRTKPARRHPQSRPAPNQLHGEGHKPRVASGVAVNGGERAAHGKTGISNDLSHGAPRSRRTTPGTLLRT